MLWGAHRQCAQECGRGQCKARVVGVFLVKWEALLGPANARCGIWWAQGAVMSVGSMGGSYSPYELASGPSPLPLFAPGCAVLLLSQWSSIMALSRHSGISGCADSGGCHC